MIRFLRKGRHIINVGDIAAVEMWESTIIVYLKGSVRSLEISCKDQVTCANEFEELSKILLREDQ